MWAKPHQGSGRPLPGDDYPLPSGCQPLCHIKNQGAEGPYLSCKSTPKI